VGVGVVYVFVSIFCLYIPPTQEEIEEQQNKELANVIELKEPECVNVDINTLNSTVDNVS